MLLNAATAEMVKMQKFIVTNNRYRTEEPLVGEYIHDNKDRARYTRLIAAAGAPPSNYNGCDHNNNSLIHDSLDVVHSAVGIDDEQADNVQHCPHHGQTTMSGSPEKKNPSLENANRAISAGVRSVATTNPIKMSGYLKKKRNVSQHL